MSVSMPQISDYQDAIQNPHLCFKDPELCKSQPTSNPVGLPRPWTGGFASVYQMHNGQKKWAVRCFYRQVPDLQKRYSAIHRHLQRSPLPYQVRFEYQEQGIKVQKQWFPIVKMEWIDGEPLNSYIEKVLKNKAVLRQLAQEWVKLIKNLQEQQIAHGDLQHGNVLFHNNQLRLIDYDGMYVPDLSGMNSNELGHSAYQHPQRTEKDFGLYIDNFSALIIYIAIQALSYRPELWNQFNNDENLLFKPQDFINPTQSVLLNELSQIQDITNHVQQLRNALLTQLNAVPNLETLVQHPAVSTIPPSEIPVTPVVQRPKTHWWRRYFKGHARTVLDAKDFTPNFAKQWHRRWTVASTRLSQKPVESLAFLNAGGEIEVLIASENRIVRRACADGHFLGEIAEHQGNIRQVITLGYEGFATASLDGTIRLSSLRAAAAKTKTIAFDLSATKPQVYSIAVNPEGNYVAASSLNRLIKIWDTGKRVEKACLNGHKRKVSSIDFFPDGKRLISGSADMTVRIWNVRRGMRWLKIGKCERILQSHTEAINKVCVAPNGKIIASGGDDKTILLWEVRSGDNVQKINTDCSVHALNFSPDSCFVLAEGINHQITCWNVLTGQQYFSLPNAHSQTITGLIITADGSKLFSSGHDGLVICWEAQI